MEENEELRKSQVLTNRQEKIKQEIEELLLPSSSASLSEKELLRKALEAMERENAHFQKIMNKLLLDLYSLGEKNGKGLSPSVNALFFHMTESDDQTGNNKVKVKRFFDFGISSNPKAPKVVPSAFSLIMSGIKTAALLLIMFTFWRSPIPLWFKASFGEENGQIDVN